MSTSEISESSFDFLYISILLLKYNFLHATKPTKIVLKHIQIYCTNIGIKKHLGKKKPIRIIHLMKKIEAKKKLKD